MQTFEVSHLGGVACFDQGFKSSLDQFDCSATQDRLLTKKIGFGFFPEIGLNDAGSSTTITGFATASPSEAAATAAAAAGWPPRI